MIAIALAAFQLAAATPARPRPVDDRVGAARAVVGIAAHHPMLVGAAPRTVVVDAGHGGVDPGMSGPIGARHKIYEKDITLAVALKLGAALKARGVHVVYTRTTDTLINLFDRGPIANAAHGDLFISVHVNAANQKWKDAAAAHGFETFFLSEAKTEDARRVEAMENAAARFDTGTPIARDDPLSFILSDMQQNEHLRESMKLADAVQRQLGTVEPGPDRGVQQANFAVLRTAFMPAVLVEIGFGTNRDDAAFVSDPRSQARMAGAIADAAVDYLNTYWAGVHGVADRVSGGKR
ncbi:MAG TPA: N-acetylmuramoyl-L-alanine amidase [Gemmatimonadaceae bacterium]|nr:N-acetylmuramoyl-L-alanine amidase [Gemmatimonadaceae bacterium]